jgi:hypothetical protein
MPDSKRINRAPEPLKSGAAAVIAPSWSMTRTNPHPWSCGIRVEPSRSEADTLAALSFINSHQRDASALIPDHSWMRKPVAPSIRPAG